MSCFYFYYHNKLWSIYSDAPSIGNIAFPDYSVTYYVSFLTEPNIQLSGIIPTNVNIFSITIYDTDAKIIYYFDDSQIIGDKNTYSITAKDLPYAYALIVRYYLNKPENPVIDNICDSDANSHHSSSTCIPPKSSISDYYLPKIVNMDTNKQYPVSSLQERQENTESFSKFYMFFAKKRQIITHSHFHEFHKPEAPTNMYFPNKRAIYSTVRVKSPEDVIVIRGTIPPNVNRQSNIRYMGFMLCNYLTTETDNSIGTEYLHGDYTVFVSTTMKNVQAHGYNKYNTSHAVLLWHPTNQFPLIVFREVKINATLSETLSLPSVEVHPHLAMPAQSEEQKSTYDSPLSSYAPFTSSQSQTGGPSLTAAGQLMGKLGPHQLNMM